MLKGALKDEEGVKVQRWTPYLNLKMKLWMKGEVAHLVQAVVTG
jgi:hypothetical protein